MERETFKYEINGVECEYNRPLTDAEMRHILANPPKNLLLDGLTVFWTPEEPAVGGWVITRVLTKEEIEFLEKPKEYKFS
jgi:hypothetical protein